MKVLVVVEVGEVVEVGQLQLGLNVYCGFDRPLLSTGDAESVCCRLLCNLVYGLCDSFGHSGGYIFPDRVR